MLSFLLPMPLPAEQSVLSACADDGAVVADLFVLCLFLFPVK